MASAPELIEQLLRASLVNNEGVLDLYAHDAVHEVPFSPTGAPFVMSYDQMAAALAASADAPPRFVDQRLERLTVHETATDTAIAEYEIRGRIASTGAPVSMVGIMLVTADGGRISRSRNFMDPNLLATVMAG
jgi:ketosteroid isomerase-like protein